MWPGRIKYTGKGEVFLTDERGRTIAVPRTTLVEVTGDNGHPDATVKIEVRDGRPEVVELHVVAKPAGREVRTGDMALFNMDNLVANVLKDMHREMEPVQESRAGEFVTYFADAKPDAAQSRWTADSVVRERRSVGRRGVSELELQRVAEVYREHASGHPVQAVEALLGCSRRTASRRIKQAEEAGLLPATTQGKKRL